MLNNILTNVLRKNFAVILITAMFFISCFFIVVLQVFAVPPLPIITSISPSSGPTAGGTSVIITGEHFEDATAVTIGGNAAVFSITDAVTIAATTPPGTAGARDVAVTAPGGTGTLTAGFTYVASHTITASAGSNGSISPSGSVSVIDGASQSFTIAPNANYHVADVLVDSVSVGAVTSYDFTNVIVDHTIVATFAINPPTPSPMASVPGIVQKTVVHFYGRAYPNAIITLLEKSGSQETPVQQTKAASSNGYFSVKIEGYFAGFYSYGLKVADKDGRFAPIKFYNMDIGPSSVNEINIFIPPTLGLVKPVVFQGDEAVLLGYATPKSELKAEVGGKSLGNFAIADASGFYRLAINTQNLSPGSYTVRIRQSDTYLGVESDWSISSSFVISTSAKKKADFNNDGKVNVIDWSVFLFRWGSRDQKLRLTIDLDGNGKIDVIDLSIFLKTIQI